MEKSLKGVSLREIVPVVALCVSLTETCEYFQWLKKRKDRFEVDGGGGGGTLIWWADYCRCSKREIEMTAYKRKLNKVTGRKKAYPNKCILYTYSLIEFKE